MEAQYDSFKRRGTTLSTDSSTYMPQRPRTKGQAYADFGSDFGPSSKRDAKSYMKDTTAGKRSNSRLDLDTSIDELDFLSQPSTDDQEVTGRKPSNTRSRDGRVKEVEYLIDGEVHKAAEGYEIDGKEKLKGLTFKKKKDTAPRSSQENPSASTPKPQPKVTRNASRVPVQSTLTKPFRTPARVNQGEGSSNPVALSRRPPSPSSPLLDPSWLHSDPEDTPRPPKARSGTRTTSVGTRRVAVVQKPPSVQGDKGKARARPADFPIPLTETSNSKTKLSTSVKPVKAPFPMDLPSSAQSEDSKGVTSKKKRSSSPPFAKQSSQSSQGSKRAVSGESKAGSVERRRKQVVELPVDDISVASSQDSKRGGPSRPAPRRPAEFPPLSPIRKTSKPKSKPKAKVSRGTVYTSEDTEDDSARPKAQPFPMATQMLEPLGPISVKRGSNSPASGSDSDDDRRRERKRARGADEIMRELMYSDGLDDEEDEAALFMDPDLDPTRLCPWCDELLPPAPSPHLQHLIDAARARSIKDPRPTNPLGLHADAAVLVNVCHRHRFEYKQIPLAHQRGWPTRIEWAKLGSRVRGYELRLQLLVDDVDEEFLPGNERQKEDDIDNSVGDDYDGGDDESLLPTRPRKGSAFWLEVVRNVKKKGVQKAAGVRGQMSNFNKTQPGYYGELGSVIISQTIYDLFPPASFPADSTLPLTPTEFIQGILVPEAALSLIMEDMNQTRQEALRTLRDSAQYGVAMFPDDAREGKSASEAIIKARAAVRREELLREEQLEAEAEDEALWREAGCWSDSALRTAIDAQTAVPESSQSRPRRECAKRAAPIVDSSDSDVSMTSLRSKRAKSKKPASRRAVKARQAGSDAIELSDTPSLSKPLSRASRAKARAASSASEAKSDAIELSDAPSLTKPRPRPRPKQKTTAYGTADARTSDIEAPSSSNPALAQVTFGARGEMHKRVQREDGSFETIDLERTPKAKKRTASGMSMCPLKIVRARPPPAGGSSLTYPLDPSPPRELTYPLDDF